MYEIDIYDIFLILIWHHSSGAVVIYDEVLGLMKEALYVFGARPTLGTKSQNILAPAASIIF